MLMMRFCCDFGGEGVVLADKLEKYFGVDALTTLS